MSFALHNLTRLAELGCEAAAVEYSVSGGKNGAGRPTLTIKVDGSLRLICQRCTGPLEYPLALMSQLEFAATEAEILDATDEMDRVLAGQAMDIASLVEDEIILALPIAPSHENCALPAIESPAVASALSVAPRRHSRGTREGPSSTSFLPVVQN